MYMKINEIIKEIEFNNEKKMVRRFIVTDLFNNVLFDNKGEGYISRSDAAEVLILGKEKEETPVEYTPTVEKPIDEDIKPKAKTTKKK